jgi:hypothetical protein
MPKLPTGNCMAGLMNCDGVAMRVGCHRQRYQ